MSIKVSTVPAQIFYYGNFARSTNMASGGTTTDNVISWDTTSLSKGMSISGTDATKITFQVPGTYNINFLGQFNFTGGSSDYHITTWYSKMVYRYHHLLLHLQLEALKTHKY